MRAFFACTLTFVLTFSALSPHSAHAQVATDIVRPASLQGPQQCRFQYRASVPGERYRQSVQYGVNLKTQIRQSGQVVADSQQRVARLQQRRVEILAPATNAKSTVQVTFDEAQQQVGGAKGKMQDVPQPVRGNTYIVSRTNEDVLSIQKNDGTEAAAAELEIVRTAMDAVGRPNPLGQFLHQKTIRVGQPVDLPKNVAAAMFSSGGKSNPEGIETITLMLRQIATVDGRSLAAFDSKIVMQDKQQAEGHVEIAGQMLLDIDTCRAVSTDLAGPLHITETRGPRQAQFTVEGRGQMKLATRTRFDQESR